MISSSVEKNNNSKTLEGEDEIKINKEQKENRGTSTSLSPKVADLWVCHLGDWSSRECPLGLFSGFCSFGSSMFVHLVVCAQGVCQL